MSRVFVPGPAEIYTGTGSAGALEFLGRSEDGVSIQFPRALEPIFADLAGSMVPFDWQDMGLNCVIRADLKIFNWDIFAKAIPPLGRTFGAIAANQIGTPMMTADYTHRLLIYWPYNALSYNSNLPVGRNFLNALIQDHTEPGSSRAQRVPVVWIAGTELSTSAGTGTLVNASTTGKPSAD